MLTGNARKFVLKLWPLHFRQQEGLRSAAVMSNNQPSGLEENKVSEDGGGGVEDGGGFKK